MPRVKVKKGVSQPAVISVWKDVEHEEEKENGRRNQTSSRAHWDSLTSRI